MVVADVALSGELKPSHAINTAMLGISTTGIGTIAAGIWFLADFGTMGVNYFFPPSESLEKDSEFLYFAS